MRARVSRKRHITTGLLTIALMAGGGLLAWQPTAAATEKQQPTTDLTDKEVALVETINSVFRKAVQKVAPAVVHIEVRSGFAKKTDEKEEDADKKRKERLPEELRRFFEDRGRQPSFKMPDDLRKFFRDHGGPKALPRMGSGSGMVVDAKNGYVLTSSHLVEGCDVEGVVVKTRDNRKFSVDWIRIDSAKDSTMTDVAVLKLKNPRGLSQIKLGNSDSVEVGDWVLAVGGPLGMRNSVTFGIISAIGRSGLSLNIQYQNFIQTDAAINPGNSGGPMVNLRGEMIGINTAIASRTGQYAGIGFSLPSNVAKWVMGQLIENKKVVRGYLGVVIEGLNMQPGLAKTFGLESDSGVVINEVVGGPARKAGLKEEDVVMAIDGKPVRDAMDLQSRIAMTTPGKKVKLKVWRNRKEQLIDLVVGKQPVNFHTSVDRRLEDTGSEPVQSGKIESLGITVEPLTETNGKKYGWKGTEGGLLITDVDDQGDAAMPRLRPGNLLLKVQDEKIKSIDHLRKLTTKKALKEGIRIRAKDHRTGVGSYQYLRED